MDGGELPCFHIAPASPYGYYTLAKIDIINSFYDKSTISLLDSLIYLD